MVPVGAGAAEQLEAHGRRGTAGPSGPWGPGAAQEQPASTLTQPLPRSELGRTVAADWLDEKGVSFRNAVWPPQLQLSPENRPGSLETLHTWVLRLRLEQRRTSGPRPPSASQRCC